MELGIFAKTYQRDSIDAFFAAIAADDLTCTQWNMTCNGLPSLPDAIPQEVLANTRAAAAAHGVEITALSATFNLIHPDPAQRAHGLAHLRVLAAACAGLGTRVLTLCTGTRDPENMWRYHPANTDPDAWTDLVIGIRAAVAIADEFDVRLGIEPERANVVSDAAHARRLLDEINSDRLGIIFDPANVIEDLPENEIDSALETALRLLAPDLLMLHGKDRALDRTVVPAGRGAVPWATLLPTVAATGFAGPLILHGLDEPDIPAAVAYLHAAL